MQHVKRRSGTSFGKECVIQREKLSLLSVFFLHYRFSGKIPILWSVAESSIGYSAKN